MDKRLKILFLAAVLLLGVCGFPLQLALADDGGDTPGDFTGALSIQNPVYQVEAFSYWQEDTLYAACTALPEEYENVMQQLLDGTLDVRLPADAEMLEQGPAIPMFASGQQMNPDTEPGETEGYIVPLLDKTSGEIKVAVYMPCLNGAEVQAGLSVDTGRSLLALAQKTSVEQPLYVVSAERDLYYVIGDTAYTFDAEPGLDYLPEIVTEGFDIEIIAILV